MTQGSLRMIAAERRRQIDAEGWTLQHDASHDRGELARAGALYALPACDRRQHDEGGAPVGWPWDGSAWKPTPGDRVRELVKAGALIAAEIDRLSPTVTLPARELTMRDRLLAAAHVQTLADSDTTLQAIADAVVTCVRCCDYFPECAHVVDESERSDRSAP